MSVQIILLAFVAFNLALWLSVYVVAMRWGLRKLKIETTRRRVVIATMLALVFYISIGVVVGIAIKSNLTVTTQLVMATIATILSVAIGMQVVLRLSTPKASMLGLIGGGGATMVTILVALMLRAVVIEAFVVPTGAMAPTVYGNRTEWVCGNCGRHFAVASMAANLGFLARDKVTCPNCEDGASTIKIGEAVGDRILCDKLSSPRRWELMVFKSPQEPTQTYVKRLVGMPGESIKIWNGDVYANGKLLQKSADQMRDLWFIVHDGRCVPKTPAKGPAWKPQGEGKPWREEGAAWIGDATAGSTTDLTYARPITIANVYDGETPNGAMPVGDVLLEMEARDFAGVALECRWAFAGQAVAWSLKSADVVSIDVVGGGHEQKPLPGPMHEASIGFAVRDGVASVLVDRRVVASVPLTGAKDGGLGMKGCELLLRVTRGVARLENLCLWRDVYYTHIGTLAIGNPVQLDDRQYFGLGDNSQESMDSRFIGAVPKQNLIGVARWTYWPPSRWHTFE